MAKSKNSKENKQANVYVQPSEEFIINVAKKYKKLLESIGRL